MSLKCLLHQEMGDLNKRFPLNFSYTEVPFKDSVLSITNDKVYKKKYDKRDDFNSEIN